MNTSADYTHEDLAKDAKARQEVAKSLAIFSAFAEGVSLYSSFAVLYSFQMRNLLKGVGQQMKWSVRDESLHSRMGCRLFNHMCEEYPELRKESKNSIYDAAKIIVDLEEKFIDKMFEMGDLENLTASDLKQFIRQRTNDKLRELGYEEIFIVNQEQASIWIGSIILLGGTLILPVLVLGLQTTARLVNKMSGTIYSRKRL